MALLQHYKTGCGLQYRLDPEDAEWTRHQIRNDARDQETYRRVQPGDQLDKCTDHVVVTNDATADRQKGDMHTTDLLYAYNGVMAKDLNEFLKDSKFGGYIYISDAAKELKMLTARKPNKAAELKGLLDKFAEEQGFSVEAFVEWEEILFAKDRRDRMAHPLKMHEEDLSFLSALVEDDCSCVIKYKNAVKALLVVARRHGLQ
ncbi:hypothetical protein HYH03_006095 [Edaphochlamys debaryana]|uniref:Uncharacterized protein n=1 Tax=Edaphochlamys debaryana TaxID=47281 RepID=A0A835Y3L4_9CHLO|nr:hypothetical protein HYH03_006095 [Edaphochlamys debaryana]|eukprot:KAG2495857.1 hypothetical protein HYH03_006095 [Edaphochlamys debaryana]